MLNKLVNALSYKCKNIHQIIIQNYLDEIVPNANCIHIVNNSMVTLPFNFGRCACVYLYMMILHISL